MNLRLFDKTHFLYVLAIIFFIFLRPWLGHGPERWWATHVADLRTFMSRSCVQPLLSSDRLPRVEPVMPIRLLVCVAAGPFRQPRFSQLEAALTEYLSYNTSRFKVTVMVDTVSIQVASALQSQFSSVPAGMHFEVKLWKASELEELFPASAGWGGEPAEYLISHAHRLYMHKLRAEFDYFVYSEDDMLVPESAIALFVDRNSDLWELGWLLGFLRIEEDSAGQQSNPDMISSQFRNPDNSGTGLRGVFEAYGQFYGAVENPYGAVWALSRNQMDNFVNDPTGVYSTGAMAFDIRARMSWGYLMAHHPDGNWFPRALLPLTREMNVDTRACVFHLPNNYCSKSNTSHCATLEQMNTVIRISEPLPLSVHLDKPCW
jgi:hypothetical protein